MSQGAEVLAIGPTLEVASTLSEGSSAEKADLPLEQYLPIQTGSRVSNEQESLDGNELK